MKKRIWSVILVLFLCFGLLAGCMKESEKHEQTLPTATTQFQATKPADIRPLPPKDPGSSLCEYDSDRQIYISGENIYVDYYVGITNAPSFNIEIYSKAYINPEDISVSFPVDLPLLVTVNQLNVKRATEYMTSESDTSGTMPYYVYYTYMGGDPKEIDTNTVLLEAFKELKPEDLPEFYVYTINVAFVNILELEVPVTVEKVDITIGEKVYETKLGRVRMFPKADFPSDADLVKRGGGWQGQFFFLYNGGVLQLMDAVKLESVTEDITVTGLRMLEEETEILEINAVITSGGQSLVMKWDGKTPIHLFKGDTLGVNLVVKNEQTEKLLNSVHLQTIVEYTKVESGEKVCSVTTHLGAFGRDLYEQYAIIFDGVDMEPYYREYFYKETSFQWVDSYRNG